MTTEQIEPIDTENEYYSIDDSSDSDYKENSLTKASSTLKLNEYYCSNLITRQNYQIADVDIMKLTEKELKTLKRKILSQIPKSQA